MGRRMIDLTGQKFGRLTVKNFIIINNKRRWICECSCEDKTIKYITSGQLNQGETNSCGCLRKEYMKEKMTKHGKSRSKTYNAWCHMITRCYNKNSQYYYCYGERGIKVCDDWLGNGGFENFLRDMGECPTKDLSLDRIDVNKNYFKENCRWATSKEQSRNMRTNVNITYNGKTQCLTDWAKENGISNQAIQRRIKKNWSLEKIFNTPVRKDF